MKVSVRALSLGIDKVDMTPVVAVAYFNRRAGEHTDWVKMIFIKIRLGDEFVNMPAWHHNHFIGNARKPMVVDILS